MAPTSHSATQTPTLRSPASIQPAFFAERDALAWAFSVDHKRIATLQLVLMLSALVVGGLAAWLLQVEHLSPATALLGEAAFARTFTLHGVVMVFLVLVPSIVGTLGLFILPLQIGAPNVAFPRLALASLHLWLLGAVLLGMSLALGGADSGWTLVVPLSTSAGAATDYVMAAIIVLVFSAMLRAIVLITTMHMLRTQGMTWRHTTPLSWSLYAHSVVTLVATPVMGLTMIMLMSERAFGMGVFDPALGGDPLLFQHFFWLPGQAITYASILPAFGLVTDVLRTAGRRPISAKKILVGIVAFAVLSLLSWGSHTPTSGHGLAAATFFALMALAMVLPAVLLVRTWVGALARGATPTAPLHMAIGFVTLFVVGGTFGTMLAVQNVGSQLHGTMFVVGHGHLMFGAVLVALVCGLHYFWPKMTGFQFAEKPARWGSWLLVLGMLLAFFPQLLAGTQGMLRRAAVYPPAHWPLQVIALTGTALLTAGLVLLVGNLLRSLEPRSRKIAADNPWGARGLEWTCPSPPPVENFITPPRVI